MEAQWQADRSMLRTLLRTHPTCTQRDYAAAVGRSGGWVRKWIKRRLMPAFGDLEESQASPLRGYPPARTICMCYT